MLNLAWNGGLSIIDTAIFADKNAPGDILVASSRSYRIKDSEQELTELTGELNPVKNLDRPMAV